MSLAVAAALLAGPAGQAAAVPGFDVQACGAAPTYGYDSSAFASGASSRRMVVRRACNPHTRGLLGLISANRVGRGRVRNGEHATFVLSAPPGTVLTHLRWAGRTHRSDCTWSVELYAQRLRAPPLWLVHEPAGRRCPSRARAATTGYGPPITRSLGFGTRLVQRVVCRNRGGCAAAGLNMIRTLSAQVRIADVSRPSISIEPSGLFGGRWVRGSQVVRFAASDNVGISSAGLYSGGRWWAGLSSACNFTRTVPCPSGQRSFGFVTSWLPDGGHNFVVRGRDSAGNVQDAPARAYIDNTPPARVSATSPEAARWLRTNAFSLSWSGAAERFAPVVAAHIKMCRARATSSCTLRRHAEPAIASLRNIAVPSPGEWEVVVWREDAAGNASEGQASVPVTLRFDPDPPRVALEAPAISDPTRVSATAVDGVSGLVGGGIELRRVGTSVWRALPTQVAPGERLVARVDDAALPSGPYEVRARAVDRAGNEASTQRRADGAAMMLTLPLRFDAVMNAGLARTKRVGRRRKRRVTSLVPVMRAPLGKHVRIGGVLTNPDGQPISGAIVYVFSRSSTSGESFAGYSTTDASGRFRYIARASQTRTLRLLYLGTALIRPSQRELSLLVPAASSLSVNRRRVRNGRGVVFRGRVRSLPVPPNGKLIEMQAHFRNRWRTFSTVRTDRFGRWRFRYRFGGTVGRVRYRFRALLPPEGGYPFQAGRSRTVAVTVVGS